MNEQLLKQFGKIKPVKPQDLERPKNGQNFNFEEIAKISHEIAKIEHEKRDRSRR